MIFTADKYLMYLRKKSNGTFTFTSELNAANRVLNDKLVIQEFFETHMVVDDTQVSALYFFNCVFVFCFVFLLLQCLDSNEHIVLGI